MGNVRIEADRFGYPMPTVLVGANVNGKANFMALAWVTKVNYKPLMVGVAINKNHHTAAGIDENGTFSVNLPGAKLIEKTDYCGLVSGKEKDKSALFEVFYGDLKTAPMVRECPLCIECRVAQVCDLPIDKLYIGDVVAAYSHEDCLTDGKPDMEKISPFILDSGAKSYRALGTIIAKAWDVGRKTAQD